MKSVQDLPLKRLSEACQPKFKMPTKLPENPANKLQPHQNELQQLGELASIYMDGRIFTVLVEFLNMGVDPNTIFTVLKSIRRSTARQSHSNISHT